jgi:signal transduction histidine kinase
VQANDQGQGRWANSASLDVDDLLEELQARARAARRSHEQLEALLDAVTAVTTNLDLSVVLGRIVRSACSLVNARYGALGVLSPDGEHLVEFVTHGISPEERARIGDLPRGHGILGLLIRDPQPRRLADIAAHPDSYGFPPNHPPMHSFLGAPIRIRDEVFGNLYLAERRGGTEFTESDEAMLVALASAAGFAIDNARLYERSQQQRLWEQASSDLTRSLLESSAEDEAFAPMVERVCILVGAQACAIALVDEDGGSSVRAMYRSGDGREEPASAPVTVLDLHAAHWAEVLGSGQELLLVPGSQPGAALAVATDLAEPAGKVPGPTAVLPITAGTGALGHLLVQWEPGDEDVASPVMVALSAFVQQIALGLIASRAHHDKARLAMLEDRDRIARDMHDLVIQRLFATGLSLQAAARLVVHPMVQSRLDEAVESLDGTIRDIRSTIFDLQAKTATADVESQLRDLLQTYVPGLGHTPVLTVQGDLDRLDAALASDLLAVVREGVSNVSRHASAASTEVHVSVRGALEVVIRDNGKGISAVGRRSGLANLESRATARSGSFAIESVEPSGTRLTWTVPLSP